MNYSPSTKTFTHAQPVFLDPTQRRWTIVVAIGSGLLYAAFVILGSSMVDLQSASPFFTERHFLRWTAVELNSIWNLILPFFFFTAVVLGTTRTILLGIFSFSKRRLPPRPSAGMSVGVVVPAFNESKVVLKTVHSLLQSSYPDLIILVIDDGSTDNTYANCMQAFAGFDNVTVVTKANGGKSDALNVGFRMLRTDVVVALDADTVFPPDTISYLVERLADPMVAAVAGNAKVGNRVNLLTRFQALEYITSQNLDRRAFDAFNAIMVVPGAVGAWRRTAVLEAGGFTTDTLAEDADLTIRLLRKGYEIQFAPQAVALTEAPETLHDFLKQRYRWTFGTMQVFRKHISSLALRDSKSVALIAMPNVLFFQFALPLLAPVIDLAAVTVLLSAWIGNWLAPSSGAHDTASWIIITFFAFTLFDYLAAIVAFMHEPREDWRLLLLILPQRMIYRQINNFVVLRALLAALRGRLVGWGTLSRSANVLEIKAYAGSGPD